ncbi:hypothetical protein T03_5176 [Trichinella britovi]|uniref:DUF7107 domain-containing protein n=1 Tax=Trichinella britovi TaxID=45882 RepID=A0A0V1CI83_TRIBR|nr:hypothetical protein T03_5176 [Trichinella britovi]
MCWNIEGVHKENQWPPSGTSPSDVFFDRCIKRFPSSLALIIVKNDSRLVIISLIQYLCHLIYNTVTLAFAANVDLRTISAYQTKLLIMKSKLNYNNAKQSHHNSFKSFRTEEVYLLILVISTASMLKMVKNKMNACLQSSQCNGMALCFRRQCISAEVLHGQTKMCRRDIECRRQLPAHERLIVGCKNGVCAKLITVPHTSKCVSRNQCPGQSICFRRHCIPAVPRNYSCQRNAQCHPTERCIGGLCFGLLGTTAESTQSLIGYADDDLIDLSSTSELILPSKEYSDIEEDISETEDSPELSSDVQPPSNTDSSSDESSEGAFSSSTNALMSKNGSMQWYSSPTKKGRLAESTAFKLPLGPTRYAIAKITDIRSSFALFTYSRMEKIILQMRNFEI